LTGPDTVVVAVARNAAEAMFIRSTLEAHDIPAATSASDPAHPSIDFVQGVHVSVPADQKHAAREVLGRLERGPEEDS
jgi:hypothetical protein